MVTFINLITIVVSLVSAFTTWQGLAYANRLAESSFQRDIVPFAAAVASFLIALGFWMSLFKWYPKVEKDKQKKMNMYVIPPVCVIIFFASTIWSIIGIGGIGALTHHMRWTVDKAEVTLTNLNEQVEKEYGIKQSLLTLSDQFKNLAVQETRGAFSSYSGAGDVVASLKSTSETLNNLANAIQISTNERRTDAEDAKENIAKLRRIIDDPEVNMNDKMVRFASMLTDVNQQFQKIHSGEIMRTIREMNNRLEELSALTPPAGESALAQAQREAIERLKTTVAAAKKIVSKNTDEIGDGANIEVDNLSSMSVETACMKYWYTIIAEIVISIALDFAPAALLIILVLTASVRQKEDEEKLANANMQTEV